MTLVFGGEGAPKEPRVEGIRERRGDDRDVELGAPREPSMDGDQRIEGVRRKGRSRRWIWARP